jgi:hypothetical protein
MMKLLRSVAKGQTRGEAQLPSASQQQDLFDTPDFSQALEAFAHIVTNHLGLKGSSAAYVSRHLKGGEVPPSVSVDYIAKVAGHIEQMATSKIQPRRPRPPPQKRDAAKPAGQ